MATAYVKLGPIGDAFSSTELGLYLLPGTASEIDDSILSNRLVNFILTGFLVRITKLEYDNIKLLNQIAVNIPGNTVPVSQPNILEPVEDGVPTPPNNSIGKRYLVVGAVPGIFLSRKDYIAQSDGLDWVYTTPTNGMILPVYSWGITVHYTGVYPSGSWDTPANLLAQALAGTVEDITQNTNAYTDAAVKAEALIRAAADVSLQNQINNLPLPVPPANKAIAIAVTDAGNYYIGGNVETILQEIGVDVKNLNIEDENLQTQINNIIDLGGTYKFLWGDVDPEPYNGNEGYTWLNTISGVLFQKIADVSGGESTWTSIYTFLPKRYIQDIPAGTLLTSLPIVFDMTSPILALFGNNIKVKIFEKISTGRYKPRTDVYYEVYWDDDIQTNLLHIDVTPDTDGTSTLDNLQVVISK